MGGSFETSDNHGNSNLKPVRLPIRKQDMFHSALEMVEDLEAWELVSKNEETCTLVCRRPGGLMAGVAEITVLVEGPDGIPSSTLNVKSVTAGGLRSRDKANVLEFVKPFVRRVC